MAGLGGYSILGERQSGAERFMGRRPLALLTGGYLLGALFGYYASVPPFVWSLLFLALSLGLLWSRRYALVFGVVMLGAAAVLSLCALRPTGMPREQVWIEGRALNAPVVGERSAMVELDHVSIDGQAHPHRLRTYLYGDSPAVVQPGDMLRFVGDVWLPQGQRNPGGFDFAAFLWARGVLMGASGDVENLLNLGADRRSLPHLLGALQGRIGAAIDRAFPEQAPLARALLMGDRTQLPMETGEDFRAAGLTHLLAISGLHISFLAFALEAMLLALGFRRKRAILGSLAVLLLYSALVGFPASVVRALLMFLMVRGAALCGRPSDALTGLCASLLLILLVRPLWVADAGLQLSYSAVLSMLLLTRPLKALLRVPNAPRWPGFGRPRRALSWALLWMLNLLVTSVAVQLGTLPVLAHWFGSVSALAPLFNLPAIPLSTLALPLMAVKLFFAMLFPGAVGWVWLQAPDWMLWLLTRFAALAREGVASLLIIPAWPTWLLLAFAACAFAASPYFKWRRSWVPLCALPVLALVSLLCARWALPGGLHLTALDAGQANALVLRAQGHTYLVDVGRENGPMADYLAHTGQRPEAIFLTHPHEDHAGGLSALIYELRPKTLYLPECWGRVEADAGIQEQVLRIQALGTQVRYLSAGERIRLSDDVSCEVLQPASGLVPGRDNGNAASLVLCIRYGQGAALLTGDLPGGYELGDYPDVDVLLAAHHGANGSNSERMLTLTNPSVLLVSVGRNGYGHPAARVLQSAESKGAAVYRTDRGGALFAQIGADGAVRMSTFLDVEEQDA